MRLRLPSLRSCLSGVALLILSSLSILGAETVKLNYGIKTGFNLAQHYAPMPKGSEYKIKTGLRPGAIAGFWLDMRVLPQFAVGYEALYSMKGSREKITVLKMDGEVLPKPALMNVDYDLDYLEVPVLLKLRAWERGRLSMEGIVGTAMSVKLHSHHALQGIVYFPDGAGFSEFPINEESDLSDVNMFDYSMVYGNVLRYDGKIKIRAELRFTLGWDYLQLPTFSLAEPVELRNQTYSAIIGLEF